MSFMFLAVEDRLSEAVGRRLVNSELSAQIEINTLSGGGNGYLRSNIGKLLQIAHNGFVMLLTDLDRKACAPLLKDDWLQGLHIPEKFMFRVCVREVESWILADREGFADFLDIPRARITSNVDDLADPKGELLRLAKRARREVKSELLPHKGNHSQQGLGYNNILSRFVEEVWNGERASENSESLRRTRQRLTEARRFFAN